MDVNSKDTVDVNSKDTALADMVKIPLLTELQSFYTSQVVQDLFHQQY